MASVDITIPVVAAATGRSPLHLVLRRSADGVLLAVFDEGNAVDIGDYVGPFVHQKCLRQVVGDFVVDFRPDADGTRDEVVVELGSLYRFTPGVVKPSAATGNAPAHLGGYTATVSGGNLDAPVMIPVPSHPWMQRWRWQSALRPIVRRYADLLAMRAILPMSSTMLFGAQAPLPVTWGGPMSLGGIPTGMGIAGDRPALGLINDHMAYWLLTGQGESSWRAMAEATGTMPCWVRDVATGALMSVRDHPYLALGPDAFHGSNTIPKPAAAAPNTNTFAMDAAHMPEASKLAWMATDDPYYLEGAQACANYNVLETNLYTSARKLPGTVEYQSTRSFVWGARDQMMMSAFCPATTPSWLLPKSYWKACLDDSRTVVMLYVNAKASPATTVFCAFTQTSAVESFMNGYAALLSGWGKGSGLFPDWDRAFDYMSAMTRKMADPNSGWDRRLQVPYMLAVAYARRGVTGYIRGVTAENAWLVPASPDTPTTWKELWDWYCVYAKGAGSIVAGAYPQAGWTDPSAWPADKLAPYQSIYLPEIRAAMAACSWAGYADAQANYPWLEAHMLSDFASPPVGNYKWAFTP